MKTFALFLIVMASLSAGERMKKALIFGVTGQDGAYLSEFLLEKGYEVHGVRRRASTFNTERVDHLYQRKQEPNRRFILHYGDLCDSINVFKLIQMILPDEIYNLAGQSHVQTALDLPEYTCNVNAMGTLRILEAIRAMQNVKSIKYYNASSSHIFGDVRDCSQDEQTPMHPSSIHAVSKMFSHHLTISYRDSYGLFACNGILFNHESPRRGGTFVTKKITNAVANITKGKDEVLYLGNIDAKRDWGYAHDFVESMWLTLQQDVARDYVIATGENHTVREFAELAFKEVGIQLAWEGKGLNEVGVDRNTGKVLIRIDPIYLRPTDVSQALGNPSKAQAELGWKHQTSFEDLVKIMVQADLRD